MARVEHTCTGCVPIDASIIDVYVTLVETNKAVTNAEAGRVTAEGERVAAETERTATFTDDHGRAVSDHSIAQQDHALAGTDHSASVAATASANAAAALANLKAELVQQRLDTADADHTRAVGDHNTAVSDHSTASSDHTRAVGDHNTAVSDHSTASSDHTTAQSDHTTAGADHNRAETDHSTAASDHTASSTATAAATAAAALATEKAALVQDKLDRADTDHTRAESDHATAASDHTTAASDHTQAGADHTLAAADHTTAGADHTQALADHAIAENDHATLDEKISHKADIDGSYDGMAVGIARNLEGRTDVTDSFFERTAGGDAEVANGTAQLNEVKGKSQVWNQLTKKVIFDFSTRASVTLSLDEYGDIVLNGTATSDAIFNVATATDRAYLIGGHKYYIKGGNSTEAQYNIYSRDLIGAVGLANSIFTALGTGRVSTERIYVLSGAVFDNYKIYPQLFDLTLLGIDNLTTVEEVEAWLAENIGEQAYYPYNAGEVLNNRMTGVESVGFNLLDPATSKADIIGAYSDVYGNYYGITGTHGALTFTDKFGNTETITPDEDGKLLLETAGTLSVADAGEDCAVFLWWDGTQTEFKPYEKNEGKLDVTHIYGKLNGEGEYVRVWPTGMPGIGDIKDSLKVVDGQVVAERKIAEVDMGTLNYSSAGSFGANSISYGAGKFVGVAKASGFIPCKLACAKYPTLEYNMANDNGIGQAVGGYQVVVWDSSLVSLTTEQVKAALDGVMAYYELETPRIYTDLIYRDSEDFADGTPVTLPVNYKVDNWGIERIVPQNTEEAVVTAKPELTMRYSIDAVEELNTHRDEIDDLYEKNEELDQRKPEKYGEYPDMAVGSAKTLAGQDTKVEDFVFKALDCADGLAKLNSARGKSWVWNQLMRNNCSSGSTTGLTYTNNGDGSITIVSDGTRTSAFSLNPNGNSQVNLVNGHKYFLRGCPAGGGNQTYSLRYNSNGFADNGSGAILICDGTALSGKISISPLIIIQQNFSGTAVFYPKLTDLTLMFGAGNEPATVEEFEAMFPLPYYDYNPGEIISNKTEEVKVVGFNQWDEEWESGMYNKNGNKVTDNTAIRSVNLIPVFPNTTYYYPKSSARINAYDSNKQFLNMIVNSIVAGTFVTPPNCYFISFGQRYEATYNHDICINLSDPAKDGTYEPYKTNTIELNLPTLTGKVNGEGESVVIAADGLKSAGSVYDEGIVENGYLTKIVKRIGVVDLGTLTYGITSDTFYATVSGRSIGKINLINTIFTAANSTVANLVNGQMMGAPDTARVYFKNTAYSTAEAFKAAMSGVLLYYELATPETYVLDTPIPATFQSYKGGTLKQIPENGSVPTTAPHAMSVTYAIDAAGILTGLPQNYLSKESLQAMLTAMQSAGIIASYTMTYNENTGKYDFTFVAPTNS